MSCRWLVTALCLLLGAGCTPGDDEEAGMPEEVGSWQTTPLWETQLALTPQSVVEWEDMARVAPTVERYQSITVPTLLLAGTETANHPSFATDEFERLLPNARKVVLEGQGHTAHRTAPDLVAGEIGAFLSALSSRGG